MVEGGRWHVWSWNLEVLGHGILDFVVYAGFGGGTLLFLVY